MRGSSLIVVRSILARSILTGSILLCAARVLAEPVNLALHRPYTLDPAPNYPLTTDPGDATDLTDGSAARPGFPAVGYLWNHKSAVGWSNQTSVAITIDLGSDQPISGASFNTAAGAAGVVFPRSIDVLVSTDARSWHEVGDLVAESDAENGPPPAGAYAIHRYRAQDWRTHGRWVKLAVTVQGPFCFVDEIEVFQGEPQALREPLAGTAVSDADTMRIRSAVKRRLGADLRGLREATAQAVSDPARRADLLRQIDGLEKQLAGGIPQLDPKTFRAVLPFPGLHERILSVQADIWRARGASPFAAWVPPSPYVPLPYIATHPEPATAATQAALTLLRGETRAIAVDLMNARDASVTLSARIEGLADTDAVVSWHRAAWTDTQSGTPIAAALPEVERIGDAFAVPLAAGMVGQIWLDLRVTDQASPGERNARLVLTTDAGDRAEIALDLSFLPLALDRGRGLHLGGFDYLDPGERYDVKSGNRAAVLRLLREHLVDVAWATRAVLPAGGYDAAGALVTPPDTSGFDAWLELWRGAARYHVFVNAEATFAGAKAGSEAFATRLSAWARFWQAHAAERGLTPGQLVLLLVDEPRSAEEDGRAVAWAKVVRGAAPKLVLWENPIWPEPQRMSPQLADLSDVLCPPRPLWLRQGEPFAAFYRTQAARGKRLCLYSASGPIERMDAYAYARLQAWQCFRIGAGEEHFWSFVDAGGASSWQPYLAPQPAYAPFFLDPQGVTAGKTMEAIRDGVQDYAILAMLRAAAEARQAEDPSDPDARAAQELLSRGVDGVLAPIDESRLAAGGALDRTSADRVRETALRLLAKLKP